MLACILCPVPGAPSDRQALDAAASIALAFDCHVVALHARPDPLAFVRYLGEGMSPGAIEALIADARRRGEEREAIARRTFDDWTRGRGIAEAQAPGTAGATCSWRREDGAEDAWIVRHGRLADMTILPVPGKEPGPAATVAAEAALIETGRPVLLAPPSPLALGGTAVVAWNASAQAARAVAAALPLLARARSVVVASVEEGGRPADPQALAQWLRWHRIEASGRRIARGAEGVAAAIDVACAEAGASLLVMGGYTHSRLRELIFGGVTAHALRSARIPVLMAH
ncbi:MAG: universal stress protein [Alphaproteobacteria bacterium]